METLLVKSENYKNYGDLKRLLISSMTQGHTRHPNSKAALYTILFKYIPERTKNNNESTFMHNSPATSVSIYQRASFVNWPPVVGINGITEDMITFYKFR